MVRGHKASGRSTDWRLRAVRLFFLFFVGVILFRLFSLQVMSAGFYSSLAEGQHSFYEELVAERGEILVQDWRDKKEYPAATNELRAFIFADPRKIEDPEGAAKAVAEVLGYNTDVDVPKDEADQPVAEEPSGDILDILEIEVPEEPAVEDSEPPAEEPATEDPEQEDDGTEKYLALIERFNKKDDPYEPVARNIEEETLQRVLALDIEGIHYIYENARFYPEANIGGHIFGFLGDNGEGSKVGRYGVEGYFDDLLSGSNGFLDSERDTAGRWIGVGSRQFKPAVDGGDVVLTIDRTVQFMACKSLRDAVDRYQADGGSLIILDPDTGAIMAMCGAPDFDPNAYFEVDDIRTFNNQAIGVPYEPGSVFKPLVMAAAINEGAVTPTTTYEDTGEVTIGEDTIRNSDLKAHGIQTMTEVLEKSLNTGMVFVMRQIGAEKMSDYIRAFGFGELTGIQLQTEAAGTIASLDKTSEIYHATASYGQGLTVTPLQIAAAYGAIANEGNLMKPYIVQATVDNTGLRDETQPTFIRNVLSSKTATTIAAMLVSVVENGHAGYAGVDGYYVAGKTGTAQVARTDGRGYDPSHTKATFAGFGPIEDPKFVMVVMIDHPRTSPWAVDTAAPVFGEVADFLLQYLQIPPTRN